MWPQLEQIERSAHSRPRESDEALQALASQVKPGSAEWVELLSLRGNANAELRISAQTNALIASLQVQDTLAPPPGAAPMSSSQAEASAMSARLAVALMQAQVLQRDGKNDLAVQRLELLRSLPESQTSWRLRLRSYGLLASMLADSGNVEAAIDAGLQSLKLAQQSQRTWRQAHSLATLAYVYLRAQQPELALKSSEEAMVKALLDPDPMLMYRVCNARAIVLAELGQAKQAEAASQQTLNYARETGSGTLLALALGNHADYLMRQGKYNQSMRLSQEGLVLAQESGDQLSEALARLNIGLSKIALKQVDEGRREVIKAIAMDEAQGQKAAVAEDWHELGVYLERAGEWADAVDAYHRHRVLSDQQLREDSRKAVLELQARFDDERQAKEITLLDRSNKLKAEQLLARDLQLRLWLAVAACVVLLGVLLTLAYQRIRVSNQALARSNADLRRQGERDPLTGLANRRHFQTAIKRLAEQGKLQGTVFLIDIDHFKRINDVHGHAAGDAVLVEVAQRLGATLREEDLVVRWGGEEFLIVVDDRQVATATALAQRLLDQIALMPVSYGAQQIHVSASIGFASFPLAPHALSVNWERAIDLVDTVMYMAKAHGRNRAFGIEAMAVEDEAGLAAMAGRMESAWHEGTVKLQALHGPHRFEEGKA
ncbi:GGDEF domain-containing protein [Paucibacter sp. Y2R2-4]|uniref:GGDEF domain-containing protein n=1 Tax=Paucibacter sp. Y2R2-4 TaxID=2893553 RepID=UPI0021E38280|nr:GGDEF domain-containing protein [Paucibacter sp. Y2R2-4]MCV2352019.1 GGDEF domain-containing protein [Paucibacter sp. Y2R2-4]